MCFHNWLIGDGNFVSAASNVDTVILNLKGLSEEGKIPSRNVVMNESKFIGKWFR